jgi:hypothetical protein
LKCFVEHLMITESPSKLPNNKLLIVVYLMYTLGAFPGHASNCENC